MLPLTSMTVTRMSSPITTRSPGRRASISIAGDYEAIRDGFSETREQRRLQLGLRVGVDHLVAAALVDHQRGAQVGGDVERVRRRAHGHVQLCPAASSMPVRSRSSGAICSENVGEELVGAHHRQRERRAPRPSAATGTRCRGCGRSARSADLRGRSARRETRSRPPAAISTVPKRMLSNVTDMVALSLAGYWRNWSRDSWMMVAPARSAAS